MSGELQTSMPRREFAPKHSRAYCEGWYASAAGQLIGTNPYPSDASAADHPFNKEWASGHNAQTTTASNIKRPGCCVGEGKGTPPAAEEPA